MDERVEQKFFSVDIVVSELLKRAELRIWWMVEGAKS